MDVLDGPLLVGATAVHEYYLDKSLVRSGRFSTKVQFSMPNEDERRLLFERMSSRLVVAEPIDWQEAAERSQGASGADIRAILNAGLALSLADGHDGLSAPHLFEALERRGHVRRHVVATPLDRWHSAVHEAGHTLLAFSLFGPEALNRVSIVPLLEPETSHNNAHFEYREDWFEQMSWSVEAWTRQLMVGYGGLLAEELLLKEVRDGSGTDLKQVTHLVLGRLLDGLDNDLGPLSPATVESDGPYGSEAMRARVWSLCERHSREALERARRVMEAQLTALETFAAALLAAESLSGERLIDELRKAGATVAPALIAA
jgi:cell division protease FtsH